MRAFLLGGNEQPKKNAPYFSKMHQGLTLAVLIFKGFDEFTGQPLGSWLWHFLF